MNKYKNYRTYLWLCLAYCFDSRKSFSDINWHGNGAGSLGLNSKPTQQQPVNNISNTSAGK
jgi:hypothetical protein